MPWEVQKVDTHEKVLQLKSTRFFVLLTGGPGLYDGADKAHDKSWYSYVKPVLQAHRTHQLAQSDEVVRWCVFSPAYIERWRNDRQAPSFIERHVKDSDLSVTRYAHTENIIAAGASDYLDSIKRRAAKFNETSPYRVEIVEINLANEFWQLLVALPMHSLSRVWYFGHAAEDLWLTLYHDADHSPVMFRAKEPTETIQRSDIQTHMAIKDRFAANPLPSKFYGCNTSFFAQDWTQTFGVPAEGAEGKVNFQASGFSGIEASATVAWRRYP